MVQNNSEPDREIAKQFEINWCSDFQKLAGQLEAQGHGMYLDVAQSAGAVPLKIYEKPLPALRHEPEEEYEMHAHLACSCAS